LKIIGGTLLYKLYGPKERILDVGCGYGNFEKVFFKEVTKEEGK
jgi:2-polyprenyl-3-methyl-5-hydroxy-6-metoxy-1,4-benzoquinol methylase